MITIIMHIHKVFLDVISKNMASLVQLGMYGAINTAGNTTNGLYFIQFLSEAYTLQNNTKVDRQVISAGKLFVKAQYRCYVQEKTNWYWKQQPLKQTIIVPTRTILHPCLEVVFNRYVQDIPKKPCSRNEEKKQYKNIQLLWLMLIIILFWMKLSVVKQFFWKGMWVAIVVRNNIYDNNNNAYT